MIRKRGGQTVVELMLILPIFMLMLFLILELGNIAYHTILAHHAAYEMARVGAMVGVKKLGGPADKGLIEGELRNQVAEMFAGRHGLQPTFELKIERTGMDPQSKGHQNEDLIVTLVYPLRLVFPGTSFIFADQPKRLGIKRLKVSVRMPVDRPLIN